MSDFSNVIRWNANFVRGLAQSVLERAKVIRESLAAKPARAAKKARVKTATKNTKKARSRKSNV